MCPSTSQAIKSVASSVGAGRALTGSWDQGLITPLVLRWVVFFAVVCLQSSNPAALFAQGFPGSSSSLGRFQQPAAANATDTVLTIEISSDQLEAPGTQQRWMKMLQNVGADRVTSRTRRRGLAKVDESTVGGVRTIRVQGFLASGRLNLPGGKFRITEAAKIRDLLQKFRDDGQETTLSEKFDFGLTANQLVALSRKLEVPVLASTKNQPVSDVVEKLVGATGLRFTRDRSARAALVSDDPVSQEYEGMSVGTALAAIAKSRGLVLVPSRQQGQDVVVEIKSVRESQESWPVGREPSGAPVAVAPKLFQKLPIGITNFPLDKVLAAFQKKAEMPIVFDEATLAQEGIDVSQTKVSISHKDGVLAVMISRLLRQSKPKMAYKLRTDDAGHPFLWITVR